MTEKKKYIRYSRDLAKEICQRLASGERLRSICNEERMPDSATVWRWSYENPEFMAEIENARMHGAHEQAEELFSHLEDAQPETPGEIAKLKLLTDHWRWWIGKLNQLKYGEKSGAASKEDSQSANLAALLDRRASARRARRDDLPLIEHAPSVPALPSPEVNHLEKIDES